MERADDEHPRFVCPCLADEVVGCEALEGLEALCEVVGADEVGEAGLKLTVIFVMGAPDGGVLDGGFTHSA